MCYGNVVYAHHRYENEQDSIEEKMSSLKKKRLKYFLKIISGRLYRVLSKSIVFRIAYIILGSNH